MLQAGARYSLSFQNLVNYLLIDFTEAAESRQIVNVKDLSIWSNPNAPWGIGALVVLSLLSCRVAPGIGRRRYHRPLPSVTLDPLFIEFVLVVQPVSNHFFEGVVAYGIRRHVRIAARQHLVAAIVCALRNNIYVFLLPLHLMILKLLDLFFDVFVIGCKLLFVKINTGVVQILCRFVIGHRLLHVTLLEKFRLYRLAIYPWLVPLMLQFILDNLHLLLFQFLILMILFFLFDQKLV